MNIYSKGLDVSKELSRDVPAYRNLLTSHQDLMISGSYFFQIILIQALGLRLILYVIFNEHIRFFGFDLMLVFVSILFHIFRSYLSFAVFSSFLNLKLKYVLFKNRIYDFKSRFWQAKKNGVDQIAIAKVEESSGKKMLQTALNDGFAVFQLGIIIGPPAALFYENFDLFVQFFDR